MKHCYRTGKPIVEISHSGLNTIASCPKRFAFRKMIVNYNESRSESDPTAAGTAIHEGIQEYMRSRNMDLAIEALARAHHIELFNVEKASQYSLEAVIHSMIHALEHGPDDGTMNITDYELAVFRVDGKDLPATEIAFLVEIETEHLMFHLRGFIDLVLKHPFSGQFVTTDIKSVAKQSVGGFEAKYKWDWQVTSYGIPLQALLGNDGDFSVGIYGIVLSDRETSCHFPSFQRSARDIKSYQYYLIDKCRQVERYYVDGIFPRQPTGCMTFGKPCFYLNDCQAETLRDMQMQINPSMDAGPDVQERPFDPVFIARLDAS